MPDIIQRLTSNDSIDEGYISSDQRDVGYISPLIREMSMNVVHIQAERCDRVQ